MPVGRHYFCEIISFWKIKSYPDIVCTKQTVPKVPFNVTICSRKADLALNINIKQTNKSIT